MATTEGDVRGLLDRNEVQDLVSRYYRGVDGHDWALLRAVFTEDVVWDWQAGDASGETREVVEGREAFIDWLRAASGGVATRHCTMAHLVQLDTDRARSESYLVTVDGTTLDTLACGVVEADHVRTPDGWRIARLHVDERLRAGSVAGWLAHQAAR